MVTLMVYEVIGKVVLYIIGTLFFGAFPTAISGDWGDDGSIFFGAWLVGVAVFFVLMLPPTT